MNEAAPPVAVFDGWASGISPDWLLITSETSVLWYRFRNAQAAPSLLRCGILALHHDKLLSATSPPREKTKSRFVSQSPRTGTPALSLCSYRIRGDARARTPAPRRTGAAESVGGDAGPQAGLRASSSAEHEKSRLSTGRSMEFGVRRGPYLAASLLRFCSVHRAQACGETSLHASEPDKTRTRARTATVGMEQFSTLRIRRARCRSRKRATKGRTSRAGNRLIPSA